MTDQASTLRKLAGERPGKTSTPLRVVSITSGKGGVGKSSLAANLACRWARQGRKVLMIDADLGLANLDIIMGLTPKHHLGHVLTGERRLDEVLVEGPEGIHILPAASGVKSLTNLSEEQRMQLVCAVEELEQEFDLVVLDTGAGIASNVRFFNAAAQELLVVVTPEPTSITDAYAVIKVMRKYHGIKRFRLIVNSVQESAEGRAVYFKLSSVTDSFLDDVALTYMGYVFRDPHVSQAVMSRQLLLDQFPASPAAKCIIRVADDFLKDAPPATALSGSMGFFFQRLLQQ